MAFKSVRHCQRAHTLLLGFGRRDFDRLIEMLARGTIVPLQVERDTGVEMGLVQLRRLSQRFLVESQRLVVFTFCIEFFTLLDQTGDTSRNGWPLLSRCNSG